MWEVFQTESGLHAVSDSLRLEETRLEVASVVRSNSQHWREDFVSNGKLNSLQFRGCIQRSEAVRHDTLALGIRRMS